MPLAYLGHTRSSHKPDHLLQTPDTFVRAALPGMSRAVAIVHAAPRLGARFTQYTAEMEPGGSLGPTWGQRFIYVLDGRLVVEADGRNHTLFPQGYIYLPPGIPHELISADTARLAVIEKPWEVNGHDVPKVLASSEQEIAGQPLMGDSALEVRSLLPDDERFDFAVNTMTYQPGASLSMVEIHVMEHGLLMLSGGGIYRLGNSWYPVEAGDFIWMAPYCPQWFGAIGKTPAKYLIYKDWNRHPSEAV